MSISVGDFVGSWRINFSTGPLSQPGQPLESLGYILIGTDTEGDSAPAFDPAYQTLVGFALLDQQGNPLLTSADVNNQPLLLMLDGTQLCWRGYYNQKPLAVYISAAEVLMPGGDRSVSLYGNTLYGDPDQVGIWGGTGSPPPNPPGGGAPPTSSTGS